MYGYQVIDGRVFKIATNVLYAEIFTTNVSYLPIWTCKTIKEKYF